MSARGRAAGGLAALAALAAGSAAPAAAAPSGGDLIDARRSLVPRVELAAARATSPEGAQVAFDAARDLQEAVRRAAPASRACGPLARGLGRYAAARVLQMEGVDRPSAADVRAGRRAAGRARAGLAAAARSCAADPGPRRAATRLALSPGPGEAYFGSVVARAPEGADAARLTADGREVGRSAVRGGRARFAVAGPRGRHRLRVEFTRRGATIGGAVADDVWLLPPGARAARPGDRLDRARADALRRALSGGPRYRAAWVQDLATGAGAGVSADAPFPAASTVKIGLMVGALARLGPGAGRGPFRDDLRAMAGWSSNLATNRILRRLGGVATAADGLRRLGARASTFPGEYVVGTELQPALPSGPTGGGPPAVSRRVTTARDLARMLFAVHAAAVGAPAARRQTGLTASQARLALGLLLASEQRGDNASLLAAGAPAGSLIAQKNGWIRSARHAAGIVYAPGGPVIAVLLTYDPAGVGPARGRALGGRVAAAASE